MDDIASGVDQEYSGAEAIKYIGEGSGFGFPDFDRLVDHQRAVEMGNDQPDAPSHFVVNHAPVR